MGARFSSNNMEPWSTFGENDHNYCLVEAEPRSRTDLNPVSLSICFSPTLTPPGLTFISIAGQTQLMVDLCRCNTRIDNLFRHTQHSGHGRVPICHMEGLWTFRVNSVNDLQFDLTRKCKAVGHLHFVWTQLHRSLRTTVCCSFSQWNVNRSNKTLHTALVTVNILL